MIFHFEVPNFGPEPNINDVLAWLHQLFLKLAPKLNELAAGGGDTGGGGGGEPEPHAPTHFHSGTDPVDVKQLAGFPGGTANFLRADRVFAQPPTGTPPALTESFITATVEATLANHRRLVAGANITIDTATPGQIVIHGQAGGAAGMNLDYLGDYAPGPVYNDGDIVIGADGVAYMCVKDGTTTPPEPWPGIGVAVNATVDATYWTVSAHPALVNERVMSSLANGYVKSTAGEPSTVAVIPVAEGGTSATTAADARTNLGVGNVGTLNLNGNPAYYLSGTGAWSIPPVPVGVPSGMIGMFAVACPAGWTRLAAWDGRFPRAMPSYGGFGGAASHAHGTAGLYANSHSHGAGSLVNGEHDHGGGGSFNVNAVTDTQGNHQHHVQPQGMSLPDNNRDADSGSSFGASQSNHSHVVHAHWTDVGGEHAHNVNVSGGVGIARDGGQPVGGATAAATAALAGAMDAADHTPYYFDVVMCQKD